MGHSGNGRRFQLKFSFLSVLQPPFYEKKHLAHELLATCLQDALDPSAIIAGGGYFGRPASVGQ
jgi:hypothetical protein